MTESSGGDFATDLEAINLQGARLGYLLVAVLMPAGVTLDIVTHPDRTTEFLIIRLASSVVALGLYGLTFVRETGVVVESLPPLVAASCIEVMILRLDPVVSPYYAGLNLTIVALAVLYVWSWKHALVVSGAIVLMWLLPIAPRLMEPSFPWQDFFNNFYFLSLTTVIAVTATALRYRVSRREHEARRELAQTSAELATTLGRLREADRLKSEFFANISHELRTPLTLIMAPVDELLAAEERPGVREALRLVRANASRLLRMIDDLLDLARLEGGQLRLRIAGLDLGAITARAVDLARPEARRRGITLSIEEAALVDPLFGDPHRVEIVLTNLIGNAIKFTPPGGEVRVRAMERDGVAEVVVEDSGPGIPKDQRERVFERFYQVHGSAGRRHGGAGIGLALARELARMHGGDITAEESSLGGALFRLTIASGRDHFESALYERRAARIPHHPARRREDASPSPLAGAEMGGVDPGGSPAPRMEGGRRARILVAEDEEELRHFLTSILATDFDVVAAADGKEALEKVERERPDLVLTDVMMPGTTGLELCRRIKADLALQSTPVILLTARSSVDATLEGYGSGADDFVEKPFHTRVLLARIHAQLALRALSVELAQQARLSSAGALAAGMAHEVRNPLNAIKGAVSVLRGGGSAKVTNEKLLAVAEEAVQRIFEVVSALDDHVRPADGLEVGICDLRKGVEATLRLLSPRLEGVEVRQTYEVSGPVRASVRSLNQVLLNLLDNALRAGARTLFIHVSQIEGRVRVTVEDDGPGVPIDVRPHLFRPFVTTRAAGAGTGLGLYLSRRLAREAGGELVYEPRPGGGSRFVLEIPVFEEAA